jgi:hypothetical protein
MFDNLHWTSYQRRTTKQIRLEDTSAERVDFCNGSTKGGLELFHMFVLFCLALSVVSACREDPAASVSSARIESDLRFLADDLLKARGPSGRGLDIAVL